MFLNPNNIIYLTISSKIMSSTLAVDSQTMALKEKVIKTWVVALFPDTKEFRVLPSNWILKTNRDNPKVTFCQWPPKINVTNDDLKAAVDPSPSWAVYRIKIYGGNKTYDSFNKAWHQQVIIEESSTESESQGLPKQNISRSSDENDNHDDTGFTIMQTSNINYNTPSLSAESSLIIASPQNVQLNSSKIAASLDTSFGINNSYDGLGHISERKLTIMSPTISSSKNPQNHTFENESTWYPQAGIGSCSISPKIEEILSNILKEQSCIRLLLNRILSKIETNIFQSNNEQSVCQLDASFLSKFPMTSVEQFKEVENCIINESDFVPKLELFIKKVGGKCPEDHSTRVMKKLFTYKYGMQCTWTGRGKDITTKIGDSELMKLTRRVIQKVSTTSIFTDSQFERVVKEWFRGASKKYSREKKNN